MNTVRKRVVFDTSSLIPVCLHPDREPARIFRQTILEHDVFSSQEALDELVAVLKRAKFDAWQPPGLRLAWVGLFRSVVRFVEIVERVGDCRDEKDNKFLELLLAANADVLIASDIHLRELHPYRGIEILTLSDFGAKYLG